MADDDGDSIVKLCKQGMVHKLPFLLEERDDAFLLEFFQDPSTASPLKDSSQSESFGESLSSVSHRSFPLPLFQRREILRTLLTKLRQDESFRWWLTLPSESRAHVILFISEFSSPDKPWSGPECYDLVLEMCEEIENHTCFSLADNNKCRREEAGRGLSLWFQNNFEQSLVPHDTDFFKVVQAIRKKMTKSCWKYYPAAALGFEWLLMQIPCPFLQNYIDGVIPPALMLTDDHYDDFRMAGLESLSHIVRNVDKSDLLRDNWANVIYDALNHRLNSDKDPRMIKLAMPSLLKLLEMIEKDPAKNSSQFTKYDELMKQALFQMEFNSNLDQKRAWMPILNDFIKKLGPAALHWSDKICVVLQEFTLANDHLIWLDILLCAASLIKNTWLKADCENIGFVILRVVFNTSTFHGVSLNEHQKTHIFDEASGCLRLLKKCEGFKVIRDQLNEIVTDGEMAGLHPDFIQAVKIINPCSAE